MLGKFCVFFIVWFVVSLYWAINSFEWCSIVLYWESVVKGFACGRYICHWDFNLYVYTVDNRWIHEQRAHLACYADDFWGKWKYIYTVWGWILHNIIQYSYDYDPFTNEETLLYCKTIQKRDPSRPYSLKFPHLPHFCTLTWLFSFMPTWDIIENWHTFQEFACASNIAVGNAISKNRVSRVRL